jgi:F-type H+-transporting ATPase subunit epsilon
MASFSFKLVTPDGTLFEGEAESVIAPGEQGSFGVLAQHAPMVALLQPGVLIIREESGTSHHFATDEGVFEVGLSGVIAMPGHAQSAASPEAAKETLKTVSAAN